jgi:hypothetical protein
VLFNSTELKSTLNLSRIYATRSNYVYAGGFSGTAFVGFKVDATTGELTPLGGSPFESGAPWPLAYATDAMGRLFMANIQGQMRVFTTANGVPSPAGDPFNSGPAFNVHGLLHPNGLYFVADSFFNHVSVYRINGSGSETRLRPVPGSPFAAGGLATTALALNQAKPFLFAANGDSRNLTTFSVDLATGVLKPLVTQPPNTLGNSGGLSGMAYLSGLEADVAPRATGGDGEVSIIDWVQVGRFATGVDIPTPGVEFQRADCAPRATSGNGEVTIIDWVQAGRYATALDPPQPAGGPTTPGSNALTKTLMRAQAEATSSGPRNVRVINTNLERGRRGTVTIELDAQGDENALGFSFSFDPAQLQFVSAALGSGASSATLNLNTSQAANGRVGLALALPAGQVITAGLRSIVTVTFDAPSSGSGASTTISFGDQPVRREISDAAANSLLTTFTSGVVTFTRNNPPAVTTTAATLIAGASATLNGRVNPNGLATNIWFEWGPSCTLANTTPAQAVGSGTTSVAVSATLSGLTPGTTYCYRLVGTNSAGTTRGSVLNFTTLNPTLALALSFNGKIRDRVGPGETALNLRISANVNSDFAHREHLRNEIGIGD